VQNNLDSCMHVLWEPRAAKATTRKALQEPRLITCVGQHAEGPAGSGPGINK
jgi:hypothetical protein